MAHVKNEVKRGRRDRRAQDSLSNSLPWNPARQGLLCKTASIEKRRSPVGSRRHMDEKAGLANDVELMEVEFGIRRNARPQPLYRLLRLVGF